MCLFCLSCDFAQKNNDLSCTDLARPERFRQCFRLVVALAVRDDDADVDAVRAVSKPRAERSVIYRK